MCDVAGWPVGAGAEVCAKTVSTPIAEQRSIALTSDFIVNSFSNDDAPTPIDRVAYHCLRGAPACEIIVLDKNNARAKSVVADLQYGATLSPAVELANISIIEGTGASQLGIGMASSVAPTRCETPSRDSRSRISGTDRLAAAAAASPRAVERASLASARPRWVLQCNRRSCRYALQCNRRQSSMNLSRGP
jgi:hypothetical protein